MTASLFARLLISIIITAVHFLSDGGGCESPVLRQSTEKSLRFSSESRFKVALFADLHFGENAWTSWGPVQDENSDRVMSTVLDSENPGENECSFTGTKRIELMKMEIEKNALSYSLSGRKDLWPSVSNYVLQVSSSEDQDSPAVFLYFLDSGGGTYPEVISNAQAKWFQEQSQAINPDARIPEVIFWHIPSKAYKKVSPMPLFGIHKPCVGSINKERVASQEAEWGIMDILVHRSSIKAVFVGHNHGLDWCCPYKSLWLCFARHTGYGGYGNWPRGARILEMTENPFSLKSWIRMEDGSKHSDVILSS